MELTKDCALLYSIRAPATTAGTSRGEFAEIEDKRDSGRPPKTDAEPAPVAKATKGSAKKKGGKA